MDKESLWIYQANSIVIERGRSELKKWLDQHSQISKVVKNAKKDIRYGDELIMALEEMKWKDFAPD